MSRRHLPHPLTVAVALIVAGAVVLIPGIAAAPPPPPPPPPWLTTGNAGTNEATNFLGTIDNKSLNIRVNNERAFRLEPGSSPNVIGGVAANSVTAGAVGATISGGGITPFPCECGTLNSVTDDFGTVGGGKGNTAGDGSGTTMDALFATVGGGSDNTATGYFSTVGGGGKNNAIGHGSTVGGGEGNNAVGGGNGNDALSDVFATVGGGEGNNATGDQFATVGGGRGNTASANFATVGGGDTNNASGPITTVSGGSGNTASNEEGGATVGGGLNNMASGDYAIVAGGTNNNASGNNAAAIGGGENNTASGVSSIVPGGEGNEATGNVSFAAGICAKADHDGAFVWADSQGSVNEEGVCSPEMHSSGANQFIVRAGGGIFFESDSTLVSQEDAFINTSTGGYLSNAGVWTDSSDRNAKEGFVPVDDQEILTRVADLPITSWSYKTEDSSVRHIGPTGQDFHAAFGLGADDKHIAALDTNGVALAAIKGLTERVEKQQRTIDALTTRIAERGGAAPSNSSSVWIILTSILSSLTLLLGAGLGWRLARRRRAMA